MNPAGRKYYAIKNGLTSEEKKYISFYELHWNLNKRVPTVKEIADYFKTPYMAVAYSHSRRSFTNALDKRGIPWRQHSQIDLTAEQIATATVMMNFADERPNSVKLKDLGVSPDQYNAWLKDPKFKTYVQDLAESNKVNVRPAALTEFAKKIQGGDWNAIKFYLETTGEMQSNEAPQTEQLIMMLIEIIQKHVKDPSVIAAIAKDILAASQNRTLELVQEPEVIDVELIEAQKMLGVG